VLAGYGAGVTPAVAQGVAPNSGVTSGWDSALPAARQFIILTAFNGEAVLDKNTGLVWEQAPTAATPSWSTAKRSCVNREIGGTVGWRLPSVVELTSVQDHTLPAPFVPASVFTIGNPGDITTPGVRTGAYWSATASVDLPDNACGAFFNHLDVFTAGKSGTLHVWCVRGPMNADAY